MKTGDLLRKNKSAYEVDAELGGIGRFTDEDGNETLSILPRFAFNSGNQDKYKNADIFTFTPGYNVLGFKVGGNYPAAIGTSGLGHTSTFSQLPSMTITNPAGVDEYKIYVSPNKSINPIQYAGDIYRQGIVPDFKNNYVAENPLASIEVTGNNTYTVRAGLRCFAPNGIDEDTGLKKWSNMYLSQTQNLTVPAVSSMNSADNMYYLIIAANNTIDYCRTIDYYEVKTAADMPNATFKTNKMYCYVTDENQVYKKDENGTSFSLYPSAIFGQFYRNVSGIGRISLIEPLGRNPVWFNTSIQPEVSKTYNLDTEKWEDFDYIYAGYVKLTSRATDALIQAAISNPFSYNSPNYNYTRFAVNNGLKNSKGEANFVVADLINVGMSINDAGYVSPNTATGNTKGLKIPIHYAFYPTGTWEVVLGIQTTATAPATLGQFFANYTLANNGARANASIAMNYNTDRTVGVYLSNGGGSDFDIVSNAKSQPLAANTRYLLKLSYDLATYKLQVSTQLTNPVWTTIWQYESTVRVYVPSQLELLNMKQNPDTHYSRLMGIDSGNAQQLGLYLNDCYLQDGTKKVWEGKNWKRVTAIAPFKYTDCEGITRIQTTNTSAEIKGMTGTQNFVIENGALKAVGKIYRQATEPDFVSDKATTIYAPSTPITYSGSTITLKAGHTFLIPMGKTPEGYRIFDRLDVTADQTWENGITGTNVASTLIIRNNYRSHPFFIFTTVGNIVYSDTPPTVSTSSSTWWFCPKDNLWRVNTDGTNITDSFDTIVPMAIVATFTTLNTSHTVSNVVPYTPQNGFPLWYDTSSESYKCYFYGE